MSEAFDAADVLQFDHVDPMSHDTLRLGEVSRDSSTLLRTGGLGLALEADFGLAIETYLPPTPPAASHATASAPIRCPSRSWASAPCRWCRRSVPLQRAEAVPPESCARCRRKCWVG
jgi:hypothetical protein